MFIQMGIRVILCSESNHRIIWWGSTASEGLNPMDYEEDFTKIDGTGLAGDIYDAILSSLSGNAFRYVLSNAREGARSEQKIWYLDETLLTIFDCDKINFSFEGFASEDIVAASE